MNAKHSQESSLLLRTLLILAMILLCAALRVLPHPRNFTPIGATALFSGAMLRNKRLAIAFPLLTLFAGDLFVGFHKLMPVVYASFLLSVAIGLGLKNNRTVARIAGATLLGAIQFFLVTNFSVWAMLGTYPKTAFGLVSCYVAGIPLFWNTLAGDSLYAILLFGGFALAKHFLPILREPSPATAR
jgi:hypothetical protein